MVVFTCNHCGESLQKPRVEKHYSFQCKREKFVTCVDCLKDFRGEEYVMHTKCITEEERYSAKGSLPKVVKKGEVKQESWMEMIQNIVNLETNLKPSVRNLLNTISSYSNVPRKKPKFINFIKSSTGGRANINDIEGVWSVIEQYKNNQSKVKEEQTQNKKEANQNGGSESSTKKRKIEECSTKKAKKSKNEDDVTSTNRTNENNDKFSFKDTILNILNQKKSISAKKLQKKVLAKYTEETGNDVTEKTVQKYKVKLKKVGGVEIDQDKGIIKLQISEP